MTPSRDELEELIIRVLEENSTSSFMGDIIIEAEAFYSIAEKICEELGLEYE